MGDFVALFYGMTSCGRMASLYEHCSTSLLHKLFAVLPHKYVGCLRCAPEGYSEKSDKPATYGRWEGWRWSDTRHPMFRRLEP